MQEPTSKRAPRQTREREQVKRMTNLIANLIAGPIL